MGTTSFCVLRVFFYRCLHDFENTVYSTAMRNDKDTTDITESTAQNTPTDSNEQMVPQPLVKRKWTRLSDLRIPSPWRTWLQTTTWGRKFAQWRLRYLLRRMEEFQQRRSFTLAVKYCVNILRWNPTQAEVWRRLGEILCQQADVLLAREQKLRSQTTDSAQNIQPQTYKTPQASSPQSEEPTSQAVSSLPPRVRLCCENALFCLNEAMRLEPDSPALFLLRAEIFERLGQDESMEADLLQAERLEFAHTENIPIVNGVVDFQPWQERWIAEWRPICTQLLESRQSRKSGIQNEVRDSMLKTVARQLRLAPCAELYLVQMALFQYLNMEKEASASFGHAVQMAPGLENYRNYITYLMSTHQFQDAVQWSLEGSQRFPKDVRLVCLRVQSRILMKDTEEALKDLQHAAELAPLNMHIWHGLIMWLLKTERFETALRVCDLAIPYIQELKKQGYTLATTNLDFESKSETEEKTEAGCTAEMLPHENPSDQKAAQFHGEAGSEKTLKDTAVKHSTDDQSAQKDTDTERDADAAPEEPETLDEALLRIRVQRIQVLQELGQSELALKELDSLPKSHPNDNQALLVTALMAHELGDEERQQRYFERCKSLQLENAWQFMERSMLCRIHEQFEDALNDLDHALALEPNDKHLLQDRALVLLQMDRLNEALETARQLQAVSPDSSTAHLLLGDIYRVMDRPENAAVEYEQILKENPRNTHALYGRAIAKHQLKLGDAALDDLAELLRLEPGNLEAARLRVEICTDLGRFNEARDELSRMLKQYPDHLGIRMGHGFAMTKEKDYEKALADFEFVYQQNPEMAAVPLAHTFVNLAQYKAALAVLDDVLSLNPKFMPAMLEKASLLLMTRQFRSLWKLITQILELDPGNAQILNFRGLLLIRKKRLHAAMDCFNQAIEQHPDSVLSYCHRSDLYMSIGDAEKALADLSTAIELEPNWSLLYLNRARIYILLEDDIAAEDDIQMGMKLARNDGDERSIADAARLRKKLSSIQDQHERFRAYTSDESMEDKDHDDSDLENSDDSMDDDSIDDDSMDDDSMNGLSTAFKENLDDMLDENDHDEADSDSDDFDLDKFDMEPFSKSPFEGSPFGKFDEFEDDDSDLDENDFEDEDFDLDKLDEQNDELFGDDEDDSLDDEFDDSEDEDEDDEIDFFDNDSEENSETANHPVIDKNEFLQFVDKLARKYPEVLQTSESDASESDASKPDTGKPDADNPEVNELHTDESHADEPHAGKTGTGEADTGEPDSDRPSTAESDTDEPDARKSSTGKPETNHPEMDKSDVAGRTDSTEGTTQDHDADDEVNRIISSPEKDGTECSGKSQTDEKSNKGAISPNEKQQAPKSPRERDHQFLSQHGAATGKDVPAKALFDDILALFKSVLSSDVTSSASQGTLSLNDIRSIYDTDKRTRSGDWDYYALPLNDTGQITDFPEAELMNEPIHEPDFIEQILPSEPDSLPDSAEESHGESTTESPKAQGPNTDSASKSDPEMP